MLAIDRLSRVPVYEQVIEEIQREIIAGVLSAGEQLMSVRELSVQLNINPNTIQKAYAELDKRGIIIAVPARGAYISDRAKDVILREKRGGLSEVTRLASELRTVGISDDEIINAVKAAFSNKNNREDGGYDKNR